MTVRSRRILPLVLSMLGSATAALGTLLISRTAGIDSFGSYIALASVAVIVSLPVSGGLHLASSRSVAGGVSFRNVVGSSCFILASYGTGVALLTPLIALIGIEPLTWLAIDWLASTSCAVLVVEALGRVQGHHLRASVARLFGGCCVLTGTIATATAPFSPVGYVWYFGACNAAIVLVILPKLLHVRPRIRLSTLARLIREGVRIAWAQAMLTLLFGFDLILLEHFSNATDVGVYGLLIGTFRRLIGIVFTDSLAPFLVARFVFAQRKSISVLRRFVPPLCVGAGIVSAIVSIAAIRLAGIPESLNFPLLLLVSIACSAHAVTMLEFTFFGIDPTLGLSYASKTFTLALVPGLLLQGRLAELGGTLGMTTAFALVNVTIAVMLWTTATTRKIG